MAYDRFIRTYSPQVPEKDSRNIQRTRKKPLGIFESKLRKINILNSKIKNVSSDIGKPEGEYSNSTNDNYMQYGFKKKNSSQEDTYKEDSLG